MSKGSRIVPVRMEDDLMHAIDAELEYTNANRREAPFTRSDWIRTAIRNKLAHARRSRSRAASIATSRLPNTIQCSHTGRDVEDLVEELLS